MMFQRSLIIITTGQKTEKLQKKKKKICSGEKQTKTNPKHNKQAGNKDVRLSLNQNKTKKKQNKPSEEFANCYLKSGRIKLMKPEPKTATHTREILMM